jgi:hypothetical protein
LRHLHALHRICPTQAIVAPHRLDARRCIAYLTIEHDGPIPEDMRAAIGNRIFGCDDCQLVCPWNKFAKRTDEPGFVARNNLDEATLAELFAWDEDEFLRRTEGSPIRRSGHQRWLRNIAVALGNAPATPDVLAALASRREHPSALVRERAMGAGPPRRGLTSRDNPAMHDDFPRSGRDERVLTPGQLNTLARDLLEAHSRWCGWRRIGQRHRPARASLLHAQGRARAGALRPVQTKSQWLRFQPREGLRVLARRLAVRSTRRLPTGAGHAGRSRRRRAAPRVRELKASSPPKACSTPRASARCRPSCVGWR